MDGKLIFKEIQYFRKTWKFYLMSAICVLLMIGMLYLWFVSPQEKSIEMLISTLFSFIIFSTVWWMLYRATLIIKIDQRNIYYSYFPFVRSERRLSKNDIVKLEMITYNAIMDHKGHGYKPRLFSKKLALTVTGSRGLSITLAKGKKLVLGTQENQALTSAIQRLKENW